MLNNLVLVGRIKEILESEMAVIITVPRPTKNEAGEYENDDIKVYLFEQVFSNMKNYCTNGDILGIKGRIDTKDGDVKIRADKVTFLSNKKADTTE